jgi:hypothetical protein
MPRRYRLRLEEYDEQGRLSRVLEESRDRLDDDFCDGEKTWGYLLSMVPSWCAALTGCSGIATVSYMAQGLLGEGIGMYRDIGEAYDRWDAVHDFSKCVRVTINEKKLSSEG